MIVLFLILWAVCTIIAWRKGWKEKSLKPFGVGFLIGFCDGIFGWGLSGTPLHIFISICLFIWLLYMMFTGPKVRKVEEKKE
jgi:uncharacterized membrane protein YfcA